MSIWVKRERRTQMTNGKQESIVAKDVYGRMCEVEVMEV